MVSWSISFSFINGALIKNAEASIIGKLKNPIIMKRPGILALVLIAMLLVGHAYARLMGGGEANPNLLTNQDALKKFRDNRFGMFIHWGPVTLRGQEISWSRGVQIPKEDYDSLYREFDPVLFNASQWVSAAKNAGMKYIVLTARHHDGFCLWDSQYTDYDMASTPYGKGVVKALVDECKKQGMDFGIYYSICDWHNPDYPVPHPDPEGQSYGEREITDPAVKAKMDRYIQYMKNQLKELIDDFNPSLIWFDGEWEWAWYPRNGNGFVCLLAGIEGRPPDQQPGRQRTPGHGRHHQEQYFCWRLCHS